jgi:hypothetical protein
MSFSSVGYEYRRNKATFHPAPQRCPWRGLMQGTHLACLRVQADDLIRGTLVGPHEASAIDRYGLRQWHWHRRYMPSFLHHRAEYLVFHRNWRALQIEGVENRGIIPGGYGRG